MSKQAADLYSAQGGIAPPDCAVPGPASRTAVASSPLLRYAVALVVTAVLTALAYPLYPQFNVTNVAMLYLLGTTFGALRLGRGPALLMSVVNLVALDYFFIPPFFSLDVADLSYTFTLAVALIVAILITQLVVTIQRHRELAEQRAGRLSALYALSRELSIEADAAGMVRAATRHVRDLFRSEVDIVLAEADCAQCPAVPGAEGALYEPLHGSRRIEGALILHGRHAAPRWSVEERQLLAALCGQLAVALERARSAATAEQARLAAERAVLCNTLLASISHDLLTPLAAIAGAGSLIALPSYELDRDRRSTLGQLIERKAQDMTGLVSNILKFTELEFKQGVVQPEWHAVDELVEHSLLVNAAALSRHHMTVEVPADLPPIPADSTLIVQILNNLLQNVSKYTPPGTSVEIKATADAGSMVITVDDDGPGLPHDMERLFEKFARGRNEGSIAGMGLGLAICRTAARLHHGDLKARNNGRGGASFELRLPLELRPGSEEGTPPAAAAAAAAAAIPA